MNPNNRSEPFWAFVERIRTILQIIAAVVVIVPAILASWGLVQQGLTAVVPAWLILLTALIGVPLGYILGRRPNIVPSRDLAILSAKYGANNGWMNVAAVLRAKIRNGKLQISVINEELGGDPAPGVVKKLEVTYAYQGQTYSKTIAETEMLSLPEP